MLTFKDIDNLGNGVFRFNYTAKDGTRKTVTFSKETLCYINCDRDEIMICANAEQGIRDQYIHDMEDRCDYLILGHYLLREKELGMTESVVKFDVEIPDPTPDNEFHTIFGETWYININNIIYVCADKNALVNTVVIKKEGFVTEGCGIVKFPGVFGWTYMKYIDANAIKNYLK